MYFHLYPPLYTEINSRWVIQILWDIVGGRSGAYEGEIGEARDKAIEEMMKRAEKLGANAIIGIDVDYEVLGEKNGMLMVSVSGTAVVVK